MLALQSKEPSFFVIEIRWDPTKRNKTSRNHQKRIFKKQGGKVMEARKREAIMACETFDDLLNAEYGERGTVEREKFEVEAETFCLAECL